MLYFEEFLELQSNILISDFLDMNLNEFLASEIFNDFFDCGLFIDGGLFDDFFETVFYDFFECDNLTDFFDQDYTEGAFEFPYFETDLLTFELAFTDPHFEHALATEHAFSDFLLKISILLLVKDIGVISEIR